MFGSRLRYLRKSNHWTFDYVAKQLGIGRSTYAGYETEFRKPSLETLTNLAKLYHVSTDYILGLSDDPKPKAVESNVYEYFKKNSLNWKGVPLSEDELKPIKELLEVIVSKRLPPQ
jgi:transcriptional regulator with XRE-family HTH domain